MSIYNTKDNIIHANIAPNNLQQQPTKNNQNNQNRIKEPTRVTKPTANNNKPNERRTEKKTRLYRKIVYTFYQDI